MKYVKWLAFFLAFTCIFTFSACIKESPLGPTAAYTFKVGVIYEGDAAIESDASFLHEAGILSMCENLGLSDDQIIRKTNIKVTDKTATKTAIAECIEGGAAIIFGTDPGYMDAMENAAKENPDVYFSCYGSHTENQSNLNTYSARIYEGEYLSGIAAGLITKSNAIGYMTDSAEEKTDVNAFAMGVYAVNPNAKIHLDAAQKEAAEALWLLGCDVLAKNCKTSAPFLHDEEMLTPLVASTLNWGVYYTLAAKDVMEGRWSSENYCGGISDELLTLTPLPENLSAETINTIETAKNQILSGDLPLTEDIDGESQYFKNIIE